MVRTIAMASASILSLTLAGAAMAQNAPQQATSGGAAAEEAGNNSNDIIITATKVATNVQDVPIAITAVTAETLETRALTSTADLGKIVPNATFRKSQGIYGQGVSVTLRGLGQTDTQFSGEPAVAYYIDDVYYPFLFGSNFDLLDIDHVEVLRGPQGTLFGRNAISGAINMVSKRPSLTDASGYVDLTVGAYDRRDFRAGFSVPLSSTLAVSASVVAKKRTGYMDILDFTCQMHKNGTPQLAGTFPFQSPGTSFIGGRKPESCVIDHLGGEDQRGIRGSAYWKPADNVELTISADYMDGNDESAAEKAFFVDYSRTYGLQPNGTVNPNAPSVIRNLSTMAAQFGIRWDERFETGSMYSTFDNFCDPFPAGTRIAGNTYYNGSLFRGGKCHGTTNPLESWGLQGKLVVGLTDQINISAIGGYRKMYTFFGSAWDGTVFNDSIIYHEDTTWNWNTELRLTGQHGWIDWNAGLFYYKGFADENGQPQNTRNGTQQFHTVIYHPRAKAAFANVTVRPIEGVSLNAGLRRSEDEKFVDYAALFDASAPGSTNFVAGTSSTVFTLPIESKRWDWKLGANYEFNQNAMVYASVATGYRLPTFNTRVFQKGQTEQNSDEALTNYEIGFKLDLFDRRLRINGAAFLIKFNRRPASFGGQEARYAADGINFEPGEQTVIPDGPDGSAYENSFTNCRAYAPSDGPKNGKTIGVTCISRTFAYQVTGANIKGLEAEISAEPIDNLRIDGSIGFTERGSETGRPVGFPDWTASGGIQYTYESKGIDGSITPRLDWFYTSTIAYNTDIVAYDEPPRSTFNGRLTYRNQTHDFDVSLGATNLFNIHYYRQKTVFTNIGAHADIGQPAPPREWYLQVKKRF